MRRSNATLLRPLLSQSSFCIILSKDSVAELILTLEMLMSSRVLSVILKKGKHSRKILTQNVLVNTLWTFLETLEI